jgi:uncharacterized membrane protein
MTDRQPAKIPPRRSSFLERLSIYLLQLSRFLLAAIRERAEFLAHEVHRLSVLAWHGVIQGIKAFCRLTLRIIRESFLRYRSLETGIITFGVEIGIALWVAKNLIFLAGIAAMLAYLSQWMLLFLYLTGFAYVAWRHPFTQNQEQIAADRASLAKTRVDLVETIRLPFRAICWIGSILLPIWAMQLFDVHRKEIAIVNKCNSELSVAVGYLHPKEGWISEGWWSIPSQSSVSLPLDIKGSDIFAYATSSDGRTWHGGGKNLSRTMAISDTEFRIVEAKLSADNQLRKLSFFHTEAREDQFSLRLVCE